MNPFLQLFARYRPIIIGGLSLVCAVAAVLLLYGDYSRRLGELEARQLEPETVDVVVADRAIPLGTRILRDAVRVAPFQKATVPPHHFSDPSEVVGRYARVALAEAEPLEPAKVITAEQGGLPVLIPDGMRAVSVEIDDVTGLENFVVPNSRVDVLVIFDAEDDSQAQVEMLLQGVQVLAVARSFDVTPEEQADKSERRTRGSGRRTVTLAVTPDEAVRLALGANNGLLQLALRNYADTVRLNVAVLRTEDIRTGQAPPPGMDPLEPVGLDAGTLSDAPLPPTPKHIVEVIRGQERTERVFY